jgi:hypothetical protein
MPNQSQQDERQRQLEQSKKGKQSSRTPTLPSRSAGYSKQFGSTAGERIGEAKSKGYEGQIRADERYEKERAENAEMDRRHSAIQKREEDKQIDENMSAINRRHVRNREPLADESDFKLLSEVTRNHARGYSREMIPDPEGGHPKLGKILPFPAVKPR